MVTVAVAGGLGDTGRTIVEEMLKANDHEVYVLSRKSRDGAPPRNVPKRFAPIIEVDYSSVDEVSSVLRKHMVDSVICTFNLHWPGAYESQINLIRAASRSGVVKKFLPTEFNVDYNCPYEDLPYPPRKRILACADEVHRHSNLADSLLRVGYFMDYLALPFLPTNLQNMYNILDLKACKAVLPGDGDSFVVWTHTRDVGKYVNELLKLPAEEFPQETAIIGERIRLTDLVSLAEKVTGTSWAVHHEPVERLRQWKTTELPSNVQCYSSFPDGKPDLDLIICAMMIGMNAGRYDIKGTVLNDLFPSVESIRLEPFLREAVEASKSGK